MSDDPCDCGRPSPAYGPHDPDCSWWQERAKRTAAAIIAIGDPNKAREFEAATNRQMRSTEHDAEERHRMAQARRLK